MDSFILTCEHQPDECDALTKELEELGPPEVIRGKDFFCSCPYGYHGGWVTVEAANADDVLASLPPVFRSHARAFKVETIRF